MCACVCVFVCVYPCAICVDVFESVCGSYDRYEKYKKGRTLEEALDLGEYIQVHTHTHTHTHIALATDTLCGISGMQTADIQFTHKLHWTHDILGMKTADIQFDADRGFLHFQVSDGSLLERTNERTN